MIKKIAAISAIVTLALVVAFALFVNVYTSDLRPDSLRYATPSAQQQERGRLLLRRMAEVHGLSAAQQSKILRFRMTDHWKGAFSNIACPWPEKETHLQVTYRLGSFDAQVTFLQGEKSGHTWGLQSWKTYEIRPDEAARFVKNEKAAFVLPAEQYLVELAFRARDAALVAYAGQETIDGQLFERVFFTWGSFEDNPSYDQYLLYIDAKTGRLEKGLFTVREKVKPFTSAVHYTNYRTIDGILVPHTITLNDGIRDPLEDYLHRIQIEEGSVVAGGDPQQLFVDPKLPTINDRKQL